MQDPSTLASRSPRAVILIDLDCFYAQCEHVRDPALSTTTPVGIQQKNIIVTANYAARLRGVGKLMLVHDALRACPDLAIRNGEDLTHYRAYSKQIWATLRAHFPAPCAIERLGLDEFFIDVTDAPVHPDSETGQLPGDCHAVGDLAGDDLLAVEALVSASWWAHTARHHILTECGFTTSAGIGPSKLAAKLVSSLHKPNLQTVIAPAMVAVYVAGLPFRAIPGLGSSVRKALREHFPTITDSTTVADLTTLLPTAAAWARIAGARVGPTLAALCRGIDSSLVIDTPTTPTQLSVEDAFASPTPSITDLESRLFTLLQSVLARFDTELGAPAVPKSLRVTIRTRSSGFKRTSASAPVVGGLRWRADENAVLRVARGLLRKLVAGGVGGAVDVGDVNLINVALVHFDVPSSSTAAGAAQPTLLAQWARAGPRAAVLDGGGETTGPVHDRAARARLDLNDIAARIRPDLHDDDDVLVLVEHDDAADRMAILMACPFCAASVAPWSWDVHMVAHDADDNID
ncbi:hypothetical protein AMAG_05844 [Allomyces macrogynus ATCC 38327]|uniref:UmuC domain-containing protein n=1 Tax=Allomyces macrogynus (strain ATCC 38327) TaxID=578462 RepID=A0A0L0SDF6_ALLM3|nr:hypothetical protein AMAG_05844 [Allomyces macrogynus ATCC 38327]|eukprot:KNE60457.1 hypothetical protein AMAG_05844 [Allomyces macrogynus ATCC 38327]